MLKDIQQQKQFKILLLGESCQDVYIFGTVDRISPEAPVPVIRKSSKEYRVGMSGNVFNNIVSMIPHCQTYVCQNDVKNLKKIRFIDQKSKYQIMRYDIEKPINELKISDIPDIKYDVVVVSDYDKGFISYKLISQIVSKFKDTKIFVDTKKVNLSSFKNCVIKLNERESKEAICQHSTAKLITTLGGRGCEYDGEIYPTESVEVYDVCGAGDVFLAAMVARWLETKDIVKSIKTANKCSALSVTRMGCYTISREEYASLCV
jgi:D-beta-D-heptose 7-phosphate kinase/D-beta-D-heptose 1-phosphate adenosyltransferase